MVATHMDISIPRSQRNPPIQPASQPLTSASTWLNPLSTYPRSPVSPLEFFEPLPHIAPELREPLVELNYTPQTSGTPLNPVEPSFTDGAA